MDSIILGFNPEQGGPVEAQALGFRNILFRRQAELGCSSNFVFQRDGIFRLQRQSPPIGSLALLKVSIYQVRDTEVDKVGYVSGYSWVATCSVSMLLF